MAKYALHTNILGLFQAGHEVIRATSVPYPKKLVNGVISSLLMRLIIQKLFFQDSVYVAPTVPKDLST